MIRLGVAQQTADDSLERNLARVEHSVAQARALGCAALCLPECCLTGYYPARAGELAISAADPALDALADMAREYGLDVLAGFMERAQARAYITHAIFRPDGTRDHYRKTHLGERERQHFEPGERLDVFGLTCGLKAGVQLCVEAHFPEITQTLSLHGAQVVFAPHSSPMQAPRRRALWQLLMPARAYDNRIYMACSNQWDGARYGGGCLVTGPDGALTAECWRDEPAVLAFDVDEVELQRYHASDADIRHRYFPGLRRAELY